MEKWVFCLECIFSATEHDKWTNYISFERSGRKDFTHAFIFVLSQLSAEKLQIKWFSLKAESPLMLNFDFAEKRLIFSAASFSTTYISLANFWGLKPMIFAILWCLVFYLVVLTLMQKTENFKIANIIGLRPQKFAKIMYVVEKDAAEKMRRFSAKSPRGFIGALSFTIKSPFLQILSTESTESKIKTMPEILAPRSFKWYMVCSCAMLSSWENPIQTSTLQSINILVIFRKKSKTLISQQLSWAGKFSPWFCDPLGPTHHLIPLTQNRYVEVVLWEMDQLLNSVDIWI